MQGETNKMKKNIVKPHCGIVMPISSIDGCDESHWAEVLDIITESIENAGFEGSLVSSADDVGIIQKRIIQNLYENPIVVCDVSGKNPNVMFELGMRLAFDKPTIIIKDDKTSYSFDTSPIEHIEYPRDLRFSKIVEFKDKLTEKISNTHEKAKNDANFTTFLKHFGEFKVAKIDKKEVSGQEVILEELRDLRYSLRRLEQNKYINRNAENPRTKGDVNTCLRSLSRKAIENLLHDILEHPNVSAAEVEELSPSHHHLVLTLRDPSKSRDIERQVKDFVRANLTRTNLTDTTTAKKVVNSKNKNRKKQ